MSRYTSFLAGAVSVAAVVGVLALSGVFDDGGANANQSTSASTSTTPPPTTTVAATTSNGGAVDVQNIYSRVSPGVVFATLARIKLSDSELNRSPASCAASWL